MNEQQTMMLERAYIAIADAGLSLKDLTSTRAAVCVACNHADSEIEFYQEPRKVIPPNIRASKALSAIAGRVSQMLDSSGACLMVDAACERLSERSRSSGGSSRVGLLG